MDYRIDDDLTKDEARYVQQNLIEFADRFAEPRNHRELAIALRDSDGNAVGGITASTVWD
jgi:hypothetical protein